MDEFTVLNTMGGVIDAGSIIAMVIAIVVAVVMLIFGIYNAVDRDYGYVAIGLIAAAWFIFLAVLAWNARIEPLRYEVTVNTGAVIDATRWDIVEQRGAIYVIQSKEAAE